MVAARCANAELDPVVTGSSLQAEAIQGRGNLFVWKTDGHLVDDFDCFQTSAAAVLTSEILLHTEFRMPSASPVNQQQNLAGGFVNISNNLLNQDSSNTLLQTHVRHVRVPNRRQVLRKT